MRTRSGAVCGFTENGVTNYLGIPFAAPPVGGLRWRPPQRVTAWVGTFRATTDGRICVEPRGNGIVGSENCLNLNVQVPAGVPHKGALAVMVEIPGGGFLEDAFGPPPDAADMVRQGHVIVVGINYRRGILGFLVDRALGPHSGDYGLEDQIAALSWVRQNIASFGGDASNVTVMGQSAGGASVCALLASPKARGLFEKAISESGFYNAAIGRDRVWEPADCKSQLPSQAEASKAGSVFVAKVGCGKTAHVAACLRKLSPATLVANAGHVLSPGAGGNIALTINGTTLTRSPARAFAIGRFNKVPVLIGVSRDELNGSVLAAPVVATTAPQYRQQISIQYGRYAAKVKKLYPLARFPSPFVAFRTVVADSDSVCPALTTEHALAKYVPVYAYQDDDADTPPFKRSPLPQGAIHVAERVFLPNTEPGLDADQAILGKQVILEWTGFARTGNPTVPHTPTWRAFTPNHPIVMSLRPAGDSELVLAGAIASRHHCRFWDQIRPRARL